MNSLRNNTQAQPTRQPISFSDFAATTTPKAAQMKIQEMLNTGQLTQQDFERAKLIAQSLMSK